MRQDVHVLTAPEDPISPSANTIVRALGPTAVAAIGSRRVALVGSGRRGSLLALALAKAGVGHLTIFDRDRVHPGDLDSGVFTAADAEATRTKAEATMSLIAAAAPHCVVTGRYEEVRYTNATELLAGHDLVVEATRSHELRQVLNEACIELKVSLILADPETADRWLVMVIVPDAGGACYRCHYPLPHPPGSVSTVDNSGTFALSDALVLGVVQRAVGRALTGSPTPAAWSIDLVEGSVSTVDNAALRKACCPLCQGRQKHFLSGKDVTYSANLCEKLLVQIGARDSLKLDLEAQARRLQAVATNISVNRFVLSCDFETINITLFANGRANVKGTKDPLKARGCYIDLLGV